MSRNSSARAVTQPQDRSFRFHVKGRGLRLANCAAFIDFDNTVTRSDVTDELLERFSVDRDWMAFEKAWQAGRIGSQECLEGQLRSVRATEPVLTAYLSAVPIDEHFTKLLGLFRQHGVEPVIVSDSFSFFIETILRSHQISGLTVHANRVAFSGDRLVPSFPYADGCPRCAHCKKQHLIDGRVSGKTLLYIGDGLSDVCPAQQAHVVFAKDSLLDYCRAVGIACVPFTNLGDVYEYLVRQVR